MTFAARASRNLSNTNNFSVPTTVATASSFGIYGIASSRAGLWVAVGYSYSNGFPYATISTDGANWTNAFQTSSSVQYNPQYVAVSPSGLFVSVGLGGSSAGLFSTSTDGINWTTPASFNGSTANFQPTYVACSSSGRFVAVGYNSSTVRGYVTTSTDGVNWTTPALMAGYNASNWIPVGIGVNSAGRWVVTGGLNNYPNSDPGFSTSTDGINWTTPSLYNGFTDPAGKNTVAKQVVANPNGKWVALFWQGNISGATQPASFVSTSTDGVTWTTPTATGSSNFYSTGIAVSPPTGRFVVVGFYGGDPPSYNNFYSMFMTSIDGTTWSTAAPMGGSTTPTNIELVASSSEGLCVAIQGGTTNIYAANAVFP